MPWASLEASEIPLVVGASNCIIFIVNDSKEYTKWYNTFIGQENKVKEKKIVRAKGVNAKWKQKDSLDAGADVDPEVSVVKESLGAKEGKKQKVGTGTVEGGRTYKAESHREDIKKHESRAVGGQARGAANGEPSVSGTTSGQVSLEQLIAAKTSAREKYGNYDTKLQRVEKKLYDLKLRLATESEPKKKEEYQGSIAELKEEQRKISEKMQQQVKVVKDVYRWCAYLQSKGILSQ